MKVYKCVYKCIYKYLYKQIDMAKKIETVNKNKDAFLRIKVGASEIFKADSVNIESFRSTASSLRNEGMRFSVSTRMKGKVVVSRLA